MSASLQKAPYLKKITQDLEDEFSVAYVNFQERYNNIKRSAATTTQSLFNKEVIPETIGMLIHENVITYENSASLELFLQTFYIVNEQDAANFGLDNNTLQKCFNRLSRNEFITPASYIALLNVGPPDNLNGFIDLYNNYIFGKISQGGKRRKSISRTRGPSKHKRRRSSSKRTKRHTRRQTKHRRH
jgi:hypothetical protein